MNEFREMLVGFWLDDGMVIPIPSHKPAAKRSPRRGVKRIVVAVAAGLGMMATTSAIALPETGAKLLAPMRAVKTSESVQADDQVPEGYWAKMIAAMTKAPQLPEDPDASELDPFI